MADEKSDTIPGFMARISAFMSALTSKVDTISDQSKRISALEADVTRLTEELSGANASVAATKDEHAATAKTLGDVQASLEAERKAHAESKAKLADPKFAGNIIARETLNSVGVQAVPEAPKADARKVDTSNLKGLAKAIALHQAAQSPSK